MPQQGPGVLRVISAGGAMCQLCARPMEFIDGNRLCCRTEGCALNGVKYDSPVVDLMKSANQSEPPAEIKETTRPARKVERATP